VRTASWLSTLNDKLKKQDCQEKKNCAYCAFHICLPSVRVILIIAYQGAISNGRRIYHGEQEAKEEIKGKR